MVNTRQEPITANGFLSAHLNKTALTTKCIQFRKIMATREKKVANREKKNGKNAITAIKLRGMQFIAQTLNERANADMVNTTNEARATSEANGSRIQNNGTDKINIRSRKMLEAIDKQKKFEIINEIIDITRPVAQISRKTALHKTKEPKPNMVLAINRIR